MSIQLNNIADYCDLEKLEQLLKNYYNLKQLSELGNETAMTIVIDIDIALNKHNMTDRQHYYLVEFYFNNTPVTALMKETNIKSKRIVYSDLQKALISLSESLGCKVIKEE